MQFEASMQRKAVEDLTRSPAAAHAAEPGAGRGLQPDYVQVREPAHPGQVSSDRWLFLLSPALWLCPLYSGYIHFPLYV